ncbi:MAG: hypothetical protein FWD24_02625 [Treponema sp.]|nr:hypothetical protein [Treponema sp.]
MKKIIIALFIFTLITPLFAQSTNDADTKFYYFNLQIERIYPTSDGYIIQYRNSGRTLGTIGIPNEWFFEAAGRAEKVLLHPGRDWPTMSIFYRNGEFSHVRLYLHRSRAHQTWGSIPQGTNVSRFFEDRDSFNIQY